MPARSWRPMKSTRPPITFARSTSSPAAGPSPATLSGMSASVAALIAVSIPFSGARRDATSAYAAVTRPAPLGEGLGGEVVREHVDPVTRHAQERGLLLRVLARHHEPVDVLEHRGLVARQRGGVHQRLGHGLAAVEREARQRVPVVAAEARPAVARRHADRAEEAQVVQVEHHGGAGLSGGGEGPGAERGQHVVHVHHVGARGRGWRPPRRPRRGRRAAAPAPRPAATARSSSAPERRA